MKEINLTIPRFRYRIETRTWRIDRDRAPYVLTAAKQQRITCAVRGENDITVTRHVAVCSFCGKETPAYARFINHKEERVKSKTQAEIEQWATRQIFMFGEPPQVMSFHTPVEESEHFACPHCGAGLSHGKHDLQVTIREGKNKLKILRRLEFDEYFSVGWVKEFQTSESDLYETVTFHLGNGRTYVSLEDGSGTACAVRDISDGDVAALSGDPVFELIRLYKPVYRELKRFFCKFWNGTLPFSNRELHAETYLLLTKFVGFDREFYNALPLSNTGAGIERSFAGIAKQLHRARKVPALLEASKLPNIKTVRKIVFSNPALLFYRKELETIWRILGDPNFFRTFLESKPLYKELSTLHQYPAMAVFYAEFTAAVGQKKFYEYLSNDHGFLHAYARQYLLLNAYEKKAERKKWTGSFFSGEGSLSARMLEKSFSVPIPPQKKDTDALECRIGGYSFARLRNSKAYRTAGKELQNCLGRWEWFQGSIYGVSKGGKFVAAIELQDGVVLQAYTYRNKEMNTNRTLFSAYSVWKQRNGIKEAATADEDLPF